MLPNNFQDGNVCIVGLGYVGLTLAVVMAEAGFRVHGVEISDNVVKQIMSGKPHFMENGLEPRLQRQIAAGRLSASTEWPEPTAVSVYIVTVGTPLNAEGVVNLNAIKSVSKTIADRLQPNNLVILRSTVKVGVTRNIVMPELAAAGLPFDIAFCPERTIEGRALEELRSLPQIAGGDSPEATMRAAQLFSVLTPSVVRVDGLETAEMIKLVNNTQRDLLFAFANEIALICDNLGVSARDVIQAGNMGYARAMMPLPGPVGGPCLSKDAYILAESTSAPNELAQISLLTRKVNESLPHQVMNKLFKTKGSAKVTRIAIFGLAFKGRPETSDLRGTLAVQLIEEARTAFPDAEIVGFDPAVPEADLRMLGVGYAPTAEAAAKAADLVIFHNNNPSFQAIDFWSLSQVMAPDALVYDMWNQFDREAVYCQNGVRYMALGGLTLD